MKKNGWMDILGGLLGMQNSPPPAQQPPQNAPQSGWVTDGRPTKTNLNYSLTKPSFDTADYSQSAYSKLLKRHEAVSKRIDLELKYRAAGRQSQASQQSAAAGDQALAQDLPSGAIPESVAFSARPEPMAQKHEQSREDGQRSAGISGVPARRTVCAEESMLTGGRGDPTSAAVAEKKRTAKHGKKCEIAVDEAGAKAGTEKPGSAGTNGTAVAGVESAAVKRTARRGNKCETAVDGAGAEAGTEKPGSAGTNGTAADGVECAAVKRTARRGKKSEIADGAAAESGQASKAKRAGTAKDKAAGTEQIRPE